MALDANIRKKVFFREKGIYFSIELYNTLIMYRMYKFLEKTAYNQNSQISAQKTAQNVKHLIKGEEKGEKNET
jgi:hypothetical protein